MNIKDSVWFIYYNTMSKMLLFRVGYMTG